MDSCVGRVWGAIEDCHGGDGESYVLASRETRRTSRVVDSGITNIKPPHYLYEWIGKIGFLVWMFFSPPFGIPPHRTN